MNFQLQAVESPLEQGLAEFSEVRKLGMNWRWEERGGWWMCTASPHFVRGRQYEGCSGIPRSASYDLSGGEKTLCGACGRPSRRIYDRKLRQVRDLWAGDTRIYLEIESRRVRCRSCGKVKQEKLAWLSNNPFYTKRFAFFVGRRCRTSTIQDVARELHLDWSTVKELDQQYMQEQLRRAGPPAPRAIGIDEVSIRKGHTYRIVVSDLERHRSIWFGGQDRSEASMDPYLHPSGDLKTPKSFHTISRRPRN